MCADGVVLCRPDRKAARMSLKATMVWLLLKEDLLASFN